MKSGELGLYIVKSISYSACCCTLQHGDKSASWNHTQQVSETILKGEASDGNFANRLEKAPERFDLNVLWISREWLNGACHLIDHESIASVPTSSFQGDTS